uniref:Uncharacterized protein n=1 Tax=Geospiza parvula TaxID=87175 RepID=A0A8U8B7Z7_GEOPR
GPGGTEPGCPRGTPGMASPANPSLSHGPEGPAGTRGSVQPSSRPSAAQRRGSRRGRGALDRADGLWTGQRGSGQGRWAPDLAEGFWTGQRGSGPGRGAPDGAEELRTGQRSSGHDRGAPDRAEGLRTGQRGSGPGRGPLWPGAAARPWAGAGNGRASFSTPARSAGTVLLGWAGTTLPAALAPTPGTTRRCQSSLLNPHPMPPCILLACVKGSFYSVRSSKTGSRQGGCLEQSPQLLTPAQAKPAPSPWPQGPAASTAALTLPCSTSQLSPTAS